MRKTPLYLAALFFLLPLSSGGQTKSPSSRKKTKTGSAIKKGKRKSVLSFLSRYRLSRGRRYLNKALQFYRQKKWHKAYSSFALAYQYGRPIFKLKPKYYLQFVHCAWKKENHKTAVKLLELYRKARPKAKVNRVMLKAYSKIKKWRNALKVADLALAEKPGDPQSLYLKGKAQYAVKIYKPALKTFDQVIDAIQRAKKKNPKRKFRMEFPYYWKSRIYREFKSFGRALKNVERALDHDSRFKEGIKLRNEILLTKTMKLDFRYLKREFVELGVYHLYTDDGTGPYRSFIKYSFVNMESDPFILRIETELVGLSEKAIRTVAIPPRGSQRRPVVVYQTPPIKHEMVRKIRERRVVNLRIRIDNLTPNGPRLLYEEACPIQVLPRTFLLHYRKTYDDPDSSLQRDRYSSVVLVTPRARFIDKLLSEAKRFHPQRKFTGKQGNSIEQVRAIFDLLRFKGVSYVLSGGRVHVRDALVQHIRSPAMISVLKSAQCLESTALFASVLEYLALKPVMVFIPGHAFVGWRKSRKDRRKTYKDEGIYYLETTMIGSSSFDTAMDRADKLMRRNRLNFRLGRSWVVKVDKQRERGLRPQPYDD